MAAHMAKLGARLVAFGWGDKGILESAKGKSVKETAYPVMFGKL